MAFPNHCNAGWRPRPSALACGPSEPPPDGLQPRSPPAAQHLSLRRTASGPAIKSRGPRGSAWRLRSEGDQRLQRRPGPTHSRACRFRVARAALGFGRACVQHRDHPLPAGERRLQPRGASSDHTGADGVLAFIEAQAEWTGDTWWPQLDELLEGAHWIIVVVFVDAVHRATDPAS